jgi:hypothetical protein
MTTTFEPVTPLPRLGMSLLSRIKDKISRAGQRALGIDELRFKLDVAIQKLNRLDWIEGELARIEAELTRSNERIQNLKSFLTWYSNRVEPWFWSGNFSQTDPEEELAGLLFNFLPNRVLVNVGPHPQKFAEAASEVGYQVISLEPPNTVTSLPVEQRSSGTIDFLNIAGEQVDSELLKALDLFQPCVVQVEFLSHSQSSNETKKVTGLLPPSQIVREMRNREYYWSVIIFRNETDGFIRLATNLASAPAQAWGRMLFFRDYQLFLKAFYWCKTTLPRFRAAPLAQ